MIKKLIGRILLITFLITATYAAIWLFPVFSGISAGIDHKENILANTPSPKIVIVGGSNTAYGIDSDLISAETGQPVVNMGWAAGLGMRYLLEQVEPHINPEDTVLLFAEYEHYYQNLLEGNQILLRLLAYRPSSVSKLTSIQQPLEIATELPLVMQIKFQDILRKPPSESAADKQAAWLAEFFTNRGDFISANQQKPLELHQIAGSNAYNDETVAVISQFYETVTASGASVYYIPPSLAQSQYDNADNADTITFIETQLATINPNWMLASASDYIFPDSYFYDTTYHLDFDQGKPARTQLILDDILPLFE